MMGSAPSWELTELVVAEVDAEHRRKENEAFEQCKKINKHKQAQTRSRLQDWRGLLPNFYTQQICSLAWETSKHPQWQRGVGSDVISIVTL